MRLVKSLSVYTGALFFNAAISFGVFSLLTNHLSEVDFGIINLYNAATIFLVPFISVGMQFVLSVDFFKVTTKDYPDFFKNGITIPVIITILVTAIALPLSPFLRPFLKINNFFFLILPLSCLFISLNEIVLSLIRNKGRHLLYAGFLTGRGLLEAALNVLFVIVLMYKWEGRLAGAFITYFVSVFFIGYLIKKWRLLEGQISKRKLKDLFSTGLPFVPERLAVFVLAYSDRFFINYFESTGDVGFYGAGAQVSLIVNIAILSLISAFHPYIFKNLSGTPNFNNLRKATYAFVGISLIITLLVIVCSPLLFQLFIGRSFHAGLVFVKYLSLGFFFWSIYAVFLAFLLYNKMNKVIMFISISGMGLSLILNYINVNNFGALGATYTSMIVYFFMAVMAMIFVNRKIGLKKILYFTPPASLKF